MDRDTRALLAAAKAANLPPLHKLTPVEARARLGDRARIQNPFVDVGEVEHLRIRGDLWARLYRPPVAEQVQLPAVVYFHGGGWVLGDVESYDTLCRRLCVSSGCVVISVNYRLAPEHPFPGPLEDCFTAVLFAHEHAAGLRVDPRRLAVAGDSAGGNLAAAVCLQNRERTRVPLRLQILFYPVTDCGCDTASHDLFAEGHGLAREEMKWFWSHYLGGADGSDALASPLRVKDPKGLPDALVLTAEYDILRDEAEAFARRLKAGGVEVELRRVPGVIHGFIHHGGFIKRGAKELHHMAAKIGARLRAD